MQVACSYVTSLITDQLALKLITLLSDCLRILLSNTQYQNNNYM